MYTRPRINKSIFIIKYAVLSLHSWVSTIQSVVLTADVFQIFIKFSMHPSPLWGTPALCPLIWVTTRRERGFSCESYNVCMHQHAPDAFVRWCSCFCFCFSLFLGGMYNTRYTTIQLASATVLPAYEYKWMAFLFPWGILPLLLPLTVWWRWWVNVRTTTMRPEVPVLAALFCIAQSKSGRRMQHRRRRQHISMYQVCICLSWGGLPSIGSFGVRRNTWICCYVPWLLDPAWSPVMNESRSFCGVPWLLSPAQNIPWNPAINESRPVVSRAYWVPRKICRGVPRVMGPVMRCPVGAESRPKCAVESRKYWIPPETDPKEKNSTEDRPANTAVTSYLDIMVWKHGNLMSLIAIIAIEWSMINDYPAQPPATIHSGRKPESSSCYSMYNQTGEPACIW